MGIRPKPLYRLLVVKGLKMADKTFKIRLVSHVIENLRQTIANKFKKTDFWTFNFKQSSQTIYCMSNSKTSSCHSFFSLCEITTNIMCHTMFYTHNSLQLMLLIWLCIVYLLEYSFKKMITDKPSTVRSWAWTDAYSDALYVTTNSAPLFLLFIGLYQNRNYFLNSLCSWNESVIPSMYKLFYPQLFFTNVKFGFCYHNYYFLFPDQIIVPIASRML